MRLIALSILLLMHPVHVTLTSIEYLGESGEIAVYVKFYVDDFLLDYRLFDKNFEPSEYVDSTAFPEEKLNGYIDDRLKLSVDGKIQKGEIENISLANNEMEVNLVYKTDGGGDKLSVYLGFLSDLYEDQSNMAIVKIGDKEEGINFTPTFREKGFNLKGE